MQQINVRGRFWVTVAVTVAAVAVWYLNGITLGQDLRGGTNLRFSLDLEKAQQQKRITVEERDRVVTDTIAIIRDRIDKYGLSETTITPLGEAKFEIALPAGAEGEAERIEKVVTDLGDLQFRIEVFPRDRYLRSASEEGVPPRVGPGTSPQDWPWAGTQEEFDAYKKAEVARYNEALDIGTAYAPSRPDMRVVLGMGDKGEPLDRTDLANFHVIETTPDAKFFTGQMLSDPQVGQDPQSQRPVALFGVKVDFQKSFGDWTGRNRYLPMAIILNEHYDSAPIIQSRLEDRVQVTMGAGLPFAETEAKAKRMVTVLQTGSLRVQPTKEAKNKIGARLAGEARDRGILATIVAFAMVLAFMIVYYRKGGLIANLALLLNLVLLVGLLAFFRATLTLPGIAGIVLTIGMAVDANILINERMFEERRRGHTVRRAISEGYDRAFTTIVDANVTSLITALFLYVYGSGPIRGFAVTLAMGLAVSMFTAVYVTRMVYEGAFARGWITEIRQLGSAIPPTIGWMRMRRFFAPISALGILFGLVLFFGEDRNTLYDVDFTGGHKLQVRFLEKTGIDDVRRGLEGEPEKVTIVTREYDEADNPQDVKHEVTAGPYVGADVIAVGTEGTEVEISVQRGVGQTGFGIDAESQAFRNFVERRFADRLAPTGMPAAPVPYRSKGDDDPRKEFDGGLAFRLNLIDPDGAVTAPVLEQILREDFPYYGPEEGGVRKPKKPAEVRLDRRVKVEEAAAPKAGLESYDVWWKALTADGKEPPSEKNPNLQPNLASFLASQNPDLGLRASLRKVASADAAARVDLSDPFPSLDVVGSTVAKKLRDDALVALFLSLLGIIVYVAIRFKSRAMGISAVLCLFHDVAFTLGIVALVNVLGLVDAKINLTMVAAFLTLVGYSVNDTVVVFDRIRENRGKKTMVTVPMIDESINQTLVRSIKTSVTVFLVCLALFVLNLGQRNVLEGFSFVLLIGTVIGSYSTIAIAAPLLLFLPWYWAKVKRFAPRGRMVSACVANPFLIVLTPFAAVLYAAWWVAFGVVVFLAGLVAFPVWALTVPAEEVALA